MGSSSTQRSGIAWCKRLMCSSVLLAVRSHKCPFVQFGRRGVTPAFAASLKQKKA
jgi:hypothetical protein